MQTSTSHKIITLKKAVSTVGLHWVDWQQNISYSIKFVVSPMVLTDIFYGNDLMTGWDLHKELSYGIGWVSSIAWKS